MTTYNFYSFVPEGDIVVYKDRVQVITWNQCAIFTVYVQLDKLAWKITETFTAFGVADEAEAREAAINHFQVEVV